MQFCKLSEFALLLCMFATIFPPLSIKIYSSFVFPARSPRGKYRTTKLPVVNPFNREFPFVIENQHQKCKYSHQTNDDTRVLFPPLFSLNHFCQIPCTRHANAQLQRVSLPSGVHQASTEFPTFFIYLHYTLTEGLPLLNYLPYL